MKIRSNYRASVLVLAVIASVALFQNCSPAAPPDVSKLSQSSTSPLPAPGSVINPTPTPAPIPVATPTPVPTPVPTPPPVSQTYSWSVGAWSSCNSGVKTRSVVCVSSLGNVVSNGNCTSAMPQTSQGCVSYTCTVTYTPPGEFLPTGLCSYSCVGTATYYAFANAGTACSANPIGVAGTETMYTADFSQTIARPFSQCSVTRNFNGAYTAESICE